MTTRLLNRSRFAQWKPPVGVRWSNAAPLPTPTGAYFLNEAGGTTLYNAVANGHNGTFNGTPFWGNASSTNPFSQQWGMGLACQLNTAFVDFGTLITSTSAMTVIVIAETNNTAQACLLSQRSSTTAIACEFIENGTPAMRFLFYNGTTTVAAVDPTTLDGKTYMWGGTYASTDASPTLRLYKNGINVASTATSGPITGTSAPFRLNNSNDAGSAANNNFYGLWVWDGIALNAAQMQWMYMNAFPQVARRRSLWTSAATPAEGPQSYTTTRTYFLPIRNLPQTYQVTAQDQNADAIGQGLLDFPSIVVGKLRLPAIRRSMLLTPADATPAQDSPPSSTPGRFQISPIHQPPPMPLAEVPPPGQSFPEGGIAGKFQATRIFVAPSGIYQGTAQDIGAPALKVFRTLYLWMGWPGR